MRIDRSVPEQLRTGVSVYYDDFKKRLSVDCNRSRPTSAFRKNNPHPPKNFLEPYHMPEEGEELQRNVHQAVAKYMNEVYQPLYSLPLNDHKFETPSLHPPIPPSLTPRPRSAIRYPVYLHEDKLPPRPMSVNGHSILKHPASPIIAEKSPPLHLSGETKRDRSVRINEAIKQHTRLPTPQPKREVWQKARTTPIPPQNNPHWVGTQQQAKSCGKRITSAPPGANGYTHYPQGRKNLQMAEDQEDMTTKVESWAKSASNYEKEVVFNMLKQVSPEPNGKPETPMLGNFIRSTGPAADYHYPGAINAYNPNLPLGAGFNSWGKQKTRKVHSAPVKKNAGLVPTATQRPLHDQRIYRLKGQDTRLNPSPGEERRLNGYMDKLEVNASAVCKPSMKRVIVPMHSYLPRKSPNAQDYQCKVSFFQSVRSPFKKHFIIHPDFTSENVKKRKPVSHTITHFRY